MAVERKDATLIELTLQGDQQAFKELVERYRERSYRVAYSFVQDYDDSRDLSQQAFIKAYRSLDRFDTGKNFFTWFYRILVNICVDHLRKHKHKDAWLEDVGDVAAGETPVQSLEQAELSERTHGILQKVPEKYRTLIILRDIEGMSCLDIAKVLKCSYTTVRWRLHRARNLFKKEWIAQEKSEQSRLRPE